MPTLNDLTSNPELFKDFSGLPADEQYKFVGKIDSDFSSLPAEEQSKFVQKLLTKGTTGQNKNAKIGDTTFPQGVRQARPEEIKPIDRKTVGEDLRPWLKGGGAAVGQIIGGGAGAATGLTASIPTGGTAAPITVPAGAVAGRIAGGAVGTEAGDLAADLIAGKTPHWSDAYKNLKEGAGWGVVGEAAAPVVGAVAKGAGKILKPAIGKLTGRGTGAVEEAIESGTSTGLRSNPLKSSTDFDRALRGEITGEDVVKNAQDGLKIVRNKREAEYLAKLQQVQADPTALTQVKAGLDSELTTQAGPNKFQIGIGRDPQGNLAINFKQSPLAKNNAVLKKAITDIADWRDTSALGLDNLKKRLSMYVDQVPSGSPSEAFLTKLRNNLSEGLKANVPQYAEMTKGYAEATTLIKDIESDLMMRKKGMSGRITADQTLRRLTSAMKDNFELRRDLVDALGTQSGKDIAGQVAGHAMSPMLPQGLEGKGILYGGVLLGHYIQPQYWPLFAASSPRAMGEFLRLFGKGMVEAKGLAPAASKAIAPAGVAATTEEKPEEPKDKPPDEKPKRRKFGTDEDQG